MCGGTGRSRGREGRDQDMYVEKKSYFNKKGEKVTSVSKVFSFISFI